MSIELPDEVSNYIAENIQSNIRQLEGAVKKIKAMHELMGERITVSLAENAIDALRTENPGLNPTPERIMEAVANYFYIPVEQMISKDRSKDVAYPRQMAMYMIRQELEYSFPRHRKRSSSATIPPSCTPATRSRRSARNRARPRTSSKSCTIIYAATEFYSAAYMHIRCTQAVYLCIYLSPVFCGIHRDKPVDNQGCVFVCGQSIFHPQSSVDDISRAAADDFGVIHRLHSLYYYCENLSFYLRGFLCPSLADTLCT